MRHSLIFFIALLVSCGGDTNNNGTSNNDSDAGETTPDMSNDTSANASDQDAGGEDAGEPEPSRTPCDPYGDSDPCGEGEGCRPTIREVSTGKMLGQCIFVGPRQLGESCEKDTPDMRCVAELICVSEVCIHHCDGDAETGAGTCPDDLGCYPLTDMGATRAFGGCGPTCEFDHDDPLNPTVACSEAGNSCFPGELLEVPFDFCGDSPAMIELGQDCAAAGLEGGTLCGPAAVCLDFMSNDQLVCQPLCLGSRGAYDQAPHPDCPNPTDVCADLFENTEIGICVAAG